MQFCSFTSTINLLKNLGFQFHSNLTDAEPTVSDTCVLGRLIVVKPCYTLGIKCNVFI